jgi:SAM-dependent methyltransferase
MVSFISALTAVAFTACLPPRQRYFSLCRSVQTPDVSSDNVKINNTNSNFDADGKCKFGTKAYWDAMYDGTADRPAESYSWYCSWEDLQPFWRMLVPSTDARVLIAGVGNDPTPLGLYDDGWTDLIAFDYSEAGVRRARQLAGTSRNDMKLLVADARNLPLESGSIDAVLDKGTLDAIGIAGKDIFVDSVKELTRVTAEGGIVVCISRVMEPTEFYEAFDPSQWEMIHDGSLAFAPDGEATIDLGAGLFSWKRKRDNDDNEASAN